MTPPERIDITSEELNALVDRIKSSKIDEKDIEVIKGMADTITFLSNAVDKKGTSIKRLLKMLFGSITEKADKLIDLDETSDSDSSGENDKPDSSSKDKEKNKAKGHGRNGSSAYTGAEQIKIEHESLKHKDPCPACEKGKVYVMQKPETIVRVTGSSPLKATVTELEKLRCNLCGEIFTAKAPKNIGIKKYDEAAGAMIILLKYGVSLPFNRLDRLQASLGVPLPSSTQWDIVDAISIILHPVYKALIYQAAQGDVVYNDDTTMKVLELMKQTGAERTGIFTSGIMSTTDQFEIALFFTGHNHAGENLAEVLSKRESILDAPIQMCDALSRNYSEDFKTILSNCIVHARRNFVEIINNFPDECEYVLKVLGKVYKNDAITKENHMSSELRLEYHQKHSKLLMNDLKEKLEEQIKNKEIEPNSEYGKAINYMLKRWDKFTVFLKVPNAPLDNNFCLSSFLENPQDWVKVA